MIRALSIVYLASLLVACSASLAQLPEEQGEAGTINISGTVQYVPLEGGFFGISGDDGKRYEPLSLNKDFAADGLKVKAVVKPVDVASIKMWGQPVKILSIRRAD